ncbi:hypothetical protein N9C66_04030 [Akkermansiaceae bacterium]|nr:hypothetical protein [Akkermansiaceae bacterium]MDA9830485.1 hypothetical protein [Akkermansiaceae bacterium]
MPFHQKQISCSKTKIRDQFRRCLEKYPKILATARWLGKRRRRLIGGFVVFSHVLGAITSVNAVMQTRTAQSAIAWAISLKTFPYVAVPSYWVFGRSYFNGYVTARHTHRKDLKEFWDEFEADLIEKNLVLDPEAEHAACDRAPFQASYPRRSAMMRNC